MTVPRGAEHLASPNCSSGISSAQAPVAFLVKDPLFKEITLRGDGISSSKPAHAPKPQLHDEFEATLRFVKPCFKNEKKKKSLPTSPWESLWNFTLVLFALGSWERTQRASTLWDHANFSKRSTSCLHGRSQTITKMQTVNPTQVLSPLISIEAPPSAKDFRMS